MSFIVTIRIGRLAVDPASRTAMIDNSRLRLTPKEYDVLELLSQHKGMTVTKGMFLDDRAPGGGVGARGRSRSPAGLAGSVMRPRRAT